jgi:tRNA pseudouridine32 synthase / 23S rRNA pseudouridine746 synthase
MSRLWHRVRGSIKAPLDRWLSQFPVNSSRHFQLTHTGDSETAVDALARISSLPKGRIKDALAKGAVTLTRRGKTKRLRRATSALEHGDILALHYNPDVLALVPPPPELIADEKQYSVWSKPAGLLAQGTPEGDHCALLRIVELQLKRDVFLVHRLDREAAGLMLVAHSARAAAAFSALFASTDAVARIKKRYRVEVRGTAPEQGEIALPIDGKPALTRYTRVAVDEARNSSTLDVELVTGRKHQIRRHCAESGFPVLGDPQYGENNKDPRGLQLFAVALEFTCPLTQRKRAYRLDPR